MTHLQVDGVDVRRRRLESLRSANATVPQEPFHFSDTLRENLINDEVGSDERLERAIDVAQLRTTLTQIPDGLDTLLGERGINLSGGQKKLLELGRGMMTDSKLLLLDEPGAGVNPTLMNKIIEMIRQLNSERGYTFCIVEHDMELIARLCDPVIVLVEGRVLTEGPFSEVSNDARVIDAYFGGGDSSGAASAGTAA